MKGFVSGRWPMVIAIIALCLAMNGCICPWFGGNNPQFTEVNTAVKVVNGTTNEPVTGVPVYFISYIPQETDVADLHYSNVTDEDGYVQFSMNYTFKPGDVLYLGASTDKSLLDSDFASKKFDGTGNIGAWKSFGYDIVKYSQGADNAYIDIVISVDHDTGKMMD